MKVAIIGTGRLGSLIGVLLATKEICKEIVLIDKDPEKAKKQAQDIDQISSTTKVYHGGYETTAVSNIIVIAINSSQKDSDENCREIKEVINKIIEFNQNAILIIATQPLDISTYIAYKVSGYNKEKVFGIGTLPAATKIKSILAKELNYSTDDLDMLVLGDQSHNMVPIISCASIQGIPLNKITGFDSTILEKTIQQALQQIKDMGEDKVNYIIPAALIINIIEAIIFDTKQLFTVSFYQNGENYGLEDIALSLPVIIGSKGIEDVLKLQLSTEESTALLASANELKKEIAALEEN